MGERLLRDVKNERLQKRLLKKQRQCGRLMGEVKDHILHSVSGGS